MKIYILEANKGSYDSQHSWIVSIHRTKEGLEKAITLFEIENQKRKLIHAENIHRLKGCETDAEWKKYLNDFTPETREIISSVEYDGLATLITREHELID